MKIRALALRKHLFHLLGASVVSIACGAVISATASPGLTPSVFSVSSSSTRAVVLESVSMRNEPFSLSSEGNFSPADPRTRITLFGTNLEFLQGEGANALTADAQDAAGTVYPLKVEYVGTVPNFDGIYMVVLRLNDLMTGNLGDVLIRLNLHGMASNRVRVGIGQIGGGPADDSAPNPAPATPPGAATPLTLAQYQAQAGAPAAVAGSDAIRFLEQATWGPTDNDLSHLRSVGIQTYLNEQFNTPPLFVDNTVNPTLSSNYPLTTLYPVNTPCGVDAVCQRDNSTL